MKSRLIVVSCALVFAAATAQDKSKAAIRTKKTPVFSHHFKIPSGWSLFVGCDADSTKSVFVDVDGKKRLGSQKGIKLQRACIPKKGIVQSCELWLRVWHQTPTPRTRDLFPHIRSSWCASFDALYHGMPKVIDGVSAQISGGGGGGFTLCSEVGDYRIQQLFKDGETPQGNDVFETSVEVPGLVVTRVKYAKDKNGKVRCLYIILTNNVALMRKTIRLAEKMPESFWAPRGT